VSDIPSVEESLAAQVKQWRAYLVASQAVLEEDVDELEDHLVAHVGDLTSSGLAPDEAFLIAVKRMGAVDDVAREFAREHSDRLWKQLLIGPGRDEPPAETFRQVSTMLGLAVGAAVSILIPRLFEVDEGVFLRNLGLLVLPFLAGHFAARKRVSRATVAALVGVFGVAALIVNLYPFREGSDTELLVALHLPIVLWLAVGVAYTGGDWRSDQKRMNFIRFTGEWFIYYVLIALGGGVLLGLTMAVFDAIGLDAELVVGGWILPAGAAGAVIVAAWLVDEKQSVIENIAPVLTRLFTPLFTIALLAFLVAVAVTGGFIDVDRTVLILFDVLLVVVLGLVLYTISARDPAKSPDRFDQLQLVLIGAALAIDLLVLTALIVRTSEFGFSANKTAALGENLVLLINLIWAGWLSLGFIRGRRRFHALEQWQTRYIPVYGVWAAIVVVIFPPLFGFR